VNWVVIIVILIILGLYIKFWFVALPLTVVAGGAYWLWYRNDQKRIAALPPEEQAALRQKNRQAQGERAQAAATSSTRLKGGPVPIVGGVPTCAKCGGTQFTARRKTSTKVMWGVYSLAGTPHNVECEVCGQRYRRPNV